MDDTNEGFFTVSFILSFGDRLSLTPKKEFIGGLEIIPWQRIEQSRMKMVPTLMWPARSCNTQRRPVR